MVLRRMINKGKMGLNLRLLWFLRNVIGPFRRKQRDFGVILDSL